MAKTCLQSQSSPQPIKPYLVYSKLRMVCKHLIPGQQEDAHEFLRYLMEAMEKAYLNRYPNSKQFDQYSKETTPINQILGGYLKTSVRCLSCSHVSVTFQHFEDLLLDIRKANTVEEALDLYFARERLEDMGYKCESCKKKVSATKQFSLERAPIALCIQLKRFSMAGNKINKHITIREHLNLSKYSSKKNGTNNEHLSYRLVAMVTHLGASQHCGHYTAIGLTDAGGYYQFDDSCVRPISLQSVLNTNTYIIFYELETNTPSLSTLSSASSWKTQANNENSKCDQRNGLISVPKICPSTQTSGNKLIDTNQAAIKRKFDIGVKLNGTDNSTESNTNSLSSLANNHKTTENGDTDHNNVKMVNGTNPFYNVKKRNDNLITIKINNTSNSQNSSTNNFNSPVKSQSYNNLTNGHQTARLPSLPTLTDDTDDYPFEVKANGSFNRLTNFHTETENHIVNQNGRTSTVAAYKSNLHGSIAPEKQTKSLVPYTSDEDEEDDDDDNDVDNFNDSGNNSPNETVKTTRSGPFQVTTTLPITKQNDASVSPTVQINHTTNTVAFKRNDLICNSETTNRESNNVDDTPKMPSKAKSTNVILKRPYQASKDGQDAEETARKLLKQQNHRGYGTNILSWNGNRSCIEKEVSCILFSPRFHLKFTKILSSN